MDSKERSWVKSFTWRIMGIFILSVLTYAVTGSWQQATLITIIFHALRVVLYWVHERVWEHIDWGRSGKGSKAWLWFWLAILILSFVILALPLKWG